MISQYECVTSLVSLEELLNNTYTFHTTLYTKKIIEKYNLLLTKFLRLSGNPVNIINVLGITN